MIGYYFAQKDRRLRYGDNRRIVVGKMHTFAGEPRLCRCGLHAGYTPWDALTYANSPILYKVDVTRKIVRGDDKFCGQRRKYLAEIDATSLLRKFACDQALKVAHLWDPPSIVLQYLHTQDPSIRAAAWDAAWDAAWAAAVDAARAAAWAAARDAARAAAWAAAVDAARATARAAVWAAARATAVDDFNSAVYAAFESIQS